MSEVKLQLCKDGPVLIYGQVTLLDHDGTVIPTRPKGVALCRCGNSGNKPFCDGTHSKIGFCGTVTATEPGGD
jgi:CDGSH-type Zn-finger protein